MPGCPLPRRGHRYPVADRSARSDPRSLSKADAEGNAGAARPPITDTRHACGRIFAASAATAVESIPPDNIAAHGIRASRRLCDTRLQKGAHPGDRVVIRIVVRTTLELPVAPQAKSVGRQHGDMAGRQFPTNRATASRPRASGAAAARSGASPDRAGARRADWQRSPWAGSPTRMPVPVMMIIQGLEPDIDRAAGRVCARAYRRPGTRTSPPKCVTQSSPHCR